MVVGAQVPPIDTSIGVTAAVSNTTIGFEKFYDLETGNISQGAGNPSAAYDLKFAFNSNTAVKARMFWNESSADVALVYDKPFETINGGDISRYYYCEHVNDNNNACANTDTAPTNFVGIYKTGEGNYFAVKYISETSSLVTLSLIHI